MSLSVGQSTIVGSVAFRKSSELSSSARGFLKIYGFSYGFPWVDGAGHEISAEVLNCCRSGVQSSCFVSSSSCNLFLYCKHYRQMLYLYDFSCLVRFVPDIFLATRLDNSKSRCQISKAVFHVYPAG